MSVTKATVSGCLKALCFASLAMIVAQAQEYYFLEGQESPIVGYSSDIYVTKDENNCTTVIHNFNPLIHKTKYHVGVVSSEGDEVAYRMYNMTFTQYLTATAGRKFDPPIEFDMVTGSMTNLMDMADQQVIDFTFANSAVSSCLATEYEAQPLATIIAFREAQGHVYDLDQYGGVIFTLATNTQVNSMQDLKDRTIGAGSITALAAGQSQLHEMVAHGLSYVADPNMVVFTLDESKIIPGVLNGEFEVGMCRTDQIERAKDADGKPLDPNIFKIINAQTHTLQNGKLFPFMSSTSLNPEWPVTALKHVALDVIEAVQDALLALGDHALSVDFGQKLRCDTTPELGQLAKTSKTAGSFAGFRPARNYFSVRTKQERAGFLTVGDQGLTLHCIRGETLYHDITCPDDYYKVLQKDFNTSCSRMGLKCPKEEYECYCKPCIHKSLAVDVFEYTGSNDVSTEQLCEKNELCGSTQQMEPIVFRIVDHMERTGAKVSAFERMYDRSKDLEVYEVEGQPWTYEFWASESQVGAAIIEISIDGIEIWDSPIRVEMQPKVCESDRQEPTIDGVCVCSGDTVDINGECVDNAIFAAIGAVGGFLVLVAICVAYVRYKNFKADEMWTVHLDELLFDDPVEVIGQGSFGVVLLAEYRGTKVAIKQAVKGKGGSTKGNRSKSLSIGERRSVINVDRDSAVGVNPGAWDDLAKNNNAGTQVVQVSSATDGDGSDSAGRTEDSSDPPPKDDIETGKSGSNLRGSAFASRKWDGGTLDFIGGMACKRRSGWFWWKKKDDYQSRFKETILGATSGTESRTTLHEFCCPWFNEHVRRREEFVREMRVLSLLRHPCITTVMGAVITRNHQPMLVMEYMDYGSLHDLLRNETMHLTGEIIMQITRSVGQGLRYLHSSKPPILHGDLKGRNILIDSRFRAKLCDFGLSVKQKGRISGTPYWLAPEYLRGETDYDTKCDIYSVGIIFYEIYARKNPYEGENFKTVLQRVCDKRINKRPEIPGTAPAKVVDLMKRCWNRDRNFRPSSRDLDLTLMDLNSEEFEPLTVEQQSAASKKRRSGDMLYELFPKHVADALKEGKKVEPEHHDLVTIVFSDIVGFTDLSQRMEPMKVSNMLDSLYLAFDKIARRHGVFKVETIGDAYMGVTNLENKQEHNHAKAAAEFAMDMVREASAILIDPEDPSKGYINIRVGFHSGPVVSNVIGSLNPRYGLFGDTVNTASRMESNSMANRILCSERSYKLLKEQAPGIKTKKRGKLNVKGKGEMLAYWVGSSTMHKENRQQQQVEAAPTRRAVEFEEEPTDGDHSERALSRADLADDDVHNQSMDSSAADFNTDHAEEVYHSADSFAGDHDHIGEKNPVVNLVSELDFMGAQS